MVAFVLKTDLHDGGPSQLSRSQDHRTGVGDRVAVEARSESHRTDLRVLRQGGQVVLPVGHAHVDRRGRPQRALSLEGLQEALIGRRRIGVEEALEL